MRRPRTIRRTVLAGVVAWAVTAAALRAVVVQPEHCGDASPDALRRSAELAVRWLAGNQRGEGTYLYRYDRNADRDVGGYNVVRHAGVMMSLEQAATARIDGAAESADAALRWVLGHLYEGPDFVAFHGDGEQPGVGASALVAAALVERRQRTGDDRYDDVMRGLGRFMLAMVDDEGAVEGYWNMTLDEPMPNSGNEFFTGEVFWALVLLHTEFPDDGFDGPATRIGEYLVVRDDVEGLWPDVTDHWAAYGFAAMTEWPQGIELSPGQLRYIRRQAGMQSLELRYESQRTNSTFSYITRGRQTLGAGMGTIGEALDQWWVVARAVHELGDLADPLASRAVCAAGAIANRQIDGDELGGDDPGQVLGAWFQFDVTQMDDQQHSLSAMLAAIPVAITQRDDA